MLEKPDIQDAAITACLQDEYGLAITDLAFLPLGADQHTAVYRAVTGQTAYFVKLRGGAFDEMTISIPRIFHDQGIKQVIAPLPTRSQRLWTDLYAYRLAVFPFIAGQNGYEMNLLDSHWVDFGRALKAIHTAEVPAAFMNRLQREGYSARWREQVKGFQALAEQTAFADSVAAELAAFLKGKRKEINELVRRAEYLAAELRARPQPLVLCHADIHAGNILIDATNRLYIVDWDTLILAPKERDLMFADGGLFGGWRSPQEEETLFYQGYGPTRIDASTLVYYRCERIVQDIAAYCRQILLTDAGGQDRENSLRQLTGQFLPGQVVEIAFESEKNRPRLHTFE